jgi:hypothetical protein
MGTGTEPEEAHRLRKLHARPMSFENWVRALRGASARPLSLQCPSCPFRSSRVIPFGEVIGEATGTVLGVAQRKSSILGIVLLASVYLSCGRETIP